MRKERKAFTVEVKRRPGVGSKKPSLPTYALLQAPEPQPADALFKPRPPEKVEAQVEEPARRILPCLVTEAAFDAAKEEALTQNALAPRPRGRPRKQRGLDDAAPLAPRKRGRPRKAAPEPVERLEQPVAPVVLSAPPAPVGQSVRAVSRRAAVGELPRGERWKRRLPKALR